MTVQKAYQILFSGALIWFSLLILIMLIRSIAGPRITDRLLSINMIGTMIISCIVLLSRVLKEPYLVDVALIYAMLSFISVLIMAMIYIPAGKKRGKFSKEARQEYLEERENEKRAEDAPLMEKTEEGKRHGT